MSPLGCPLSLLVPGSYKGPAGQGQRLHEGFLPPAVRTSITSRYETVYRSTTAQEEAALDVATARGTGTRDRSCWGSSVGE